MQIKVLNIFYGADGLPYKDVERTVHYPITSGTFLGSSNTTEIRFYYDRLDELNESTFVAVSKLPNGKIGSEILESKRDNELEENYAVLNLSSFYTQYKGDVYIALQGYQGGVRVEEDENGIYSIIGTPTIKATGSIRLSIAYAPMFVGSGQTENITLQRVLADLATKLGIRQETLHVEELPSIGNPNIWYVVNNDENDPTKANIYIWNETTQNYVWVGDNTLNLGNYYTKAEGEQFENSLNEDVSSFKNDVNLRVTSVENELESVASGSPAGVYTDVEALEIADPDHSRIYLIQETGEWYYWDGTAWESGGDYLSSSLPDNYLDKTSSNTVKNSKLSSVISFNRSVDNLIPLDKSNWAMTTEGGVASTIRMFSTYVAVKPSSQLLLKCDSDIKLIIHQYYYSNGAYVDNGYAYNKDLTASAGSQNGDYHGDGDIYLIKSNTTHIRIYFKFTDDRTFTLEDIVNFNMKLSYVENLEDYQKNIIDLLQNNGGNGIILKPEDFKVGSITSGGDNDAQNRMCSINKTSYSSGDTLKLTFLNNTSGWKIRPIFYNGDTFVSEGSLYADSATVSLPLNANAFRFVLQKVTNSLERYIVPSEIVEIPLLLSIENSTSNYKENIDYLSKFAGNIISLNQDNWFQGGVISGTPTAGTIRINQLIENVGARLLKFIAYNGWDCSIECYNESNTYIGSAYDYGNATQTGGWKPSGTLFVIPSYVKNIRVVLRRHDDSTILVSDIINSPVFLFDVNTISSEEEIQLLKTNVKNLMSVNPNDYENGSILGNGTENSVGARMKTKSSSAFTVNPLKKYKISFLKNTSWKLLIVYYTSGGTFISSTDYYTTDAIIVPHQDAGKVRVVFANDSASNAITPAMLYEIPIIVEEYESEQTTLDKISGIDRAMFKEHIIIMTFNLGQFYNGAQKCPDDQVAIQKARYQELFAKYQPDLICTQETPEYANVGNTVKGSTFFEDRYQYYEGNLGSLGQMYVSNKPILQQPLKVFYTSGSDTSRYYEKTYVYFNGIKIAVFNTHLALTSADRELEIAELITAMSAEEYVILCGDFNNNDGISELSAFTTAGYVLANGGTLGTFNTCGSLAIDNIIVSPNITIEKAKVENVLFEDRNDHRPFCAMLKIGIADIWNS